MNLWFSKSNGTKTALLSIKYQVDKTSISFACIGFLARELAHELFEFAFLLAELLASL